MFPTEKSEKGINTRSRVEKRNSKIEFDSPRFPFISRDHRNQREQEKRSIKFRFAGHWQRVEGNISFLISRSGFCGGSELRSFESIFRKGEKSS